jgi:hypothetical protein
MMLQFIVLMAVLAVAFSSNLVANYYTDVENCKTGLTAQAFIPMGKCIQVPDIPPSFNVSVPFKSFKSECTQNADGSIATSNKIYAASTSCGGLGVPVKETIPAGCSTGGLFTCIADMSSSDSVVAAWPAVAAFFGDSSCGTWDVQAAFEPSTCVGISGKKGTGSLLVDVTATDMTAQGWDGVTDCSGAATKSYSIPIGACQQMALPTMKSAQHVEMYKSSLSAFAALLSRAVNLEVSPALTAWLSAELSKSDHNLESSAAIFAKAGVAGKI